MNLNPYESPITEATGRTSIASDHRGPFQMTVIGFFAGGMLGATAGGVASGLLGLVGSIVVMSSEDFVAGSGENLVVGLTLAGAIFGAVLGGLGGTVLGAGLGLAAGLCNERFRGGLLYVSMAFCALLGAAGGCFGGFFLGGLRAGPTAVSLGTFAIGITLGLLCGCGGGFVLGRGLGYLAWGRGSSK